MLPRSSFVHIPRFCRGHLLAGCCVALAAISVGDPALAQNNIAATKHNLSVTGTGVIKSPAGSGQIEMCNFCHTPHTPPGPVDRALWNHPLSSATYTRYTSSSLDARNLTDGGDGLPAGGSKLCLSCHDGTLALGSVLNAPGSGTGSALQLDGTDGGKMRHGQASYPYSGYTRNLSSNLSNDHPISVTFNNALTLADGELRRVDSVQKDEATGGTLIGVRGPGYKPTLPLINTGVGGMGQVQCTTCHDPHKSSEKFLRLSRMQVTPPVAGFSTGNQICLTCHEKLGNTWVQSAHADPVVANEKYTVAAQNRNDFRPSPPLVWQAACLNCHDTHTVQGSRRLLREGVNSALGGSGAGSFRVGSDATPVDTVSAIENTCFQCHDDVNSTTRVLDKTYVPPEPQASTVPDIRSEYNRAVRMPITTADQPGGGHEVHDITSADFVEPAANLGLNDSSKRHAECTDCHNPHRVRRRSTFYGVSSATGEGAKRTHNVGGTPEKLGADGNIASGALRGIWGVEPVYLNRSSLPAWPSNPDSYDLKKGDPASSQTNREESYLTREYQLCFKCHSDYSNGALATSFPDYRDGVGATPAGYRNELTKFTNVAAEFSAVNATDPPTSGTDQGEYGNDTLFTPNGSLPADGAPGEPNPDPTGVQNHRSWHPVVWPTGRTRKERTGSNNPGDFQNIRAPFNVDANQGYQTMHCSDCHGSDVSWIQGTGPDTTKVQGPHGSNNPFLLKGVWRFDNNVSENITPSINSASGSNTSGSICGRCHDPKGKGGGFNTGSASHGASFKSSWSCFRCHIAVPHGWKNKAFLSNLNCVGSEIAGYAAGCTNHAGNDTSTALLPPYYIGAKLRVRQWRRSTQWQVANDSYLFCGGVTTYGKGWMGTVCGGWDASNMPP